MSYNSGLIWGGLAWIVSIILMLWVWVAEAHAEPVFVLGAGAGTCGELAQMYAVDPETAYRMYYSWAQGYMSGINAMGRVLTTPQFVDLSPDIDEQWAFIRRYCNEHPLDDFYNAVWDLLTTFETVPNVRPALSD